MELPQKRAKNCPDDDMTVDEATSPTAAQQIAELQAELARCKVEHERVVRDVKGSYLDALKWAYTVDTPALDPSDPFYSLRPAHSIHRIHWLMRGHTEDYIDSMERLLSTFKHIIKELRTGSYDKDCVPIYFELWDGYGRRVTAVHDDVLLPYWKELANALVHWSEYHANGRTLEIEIHHIKTPDAVLNVLRPASLVTTPLELESLPSSSYIQTVGLRMQVSQKRAEKRPGKEATSPTAVRQVAELQTELARCKIEHEKVVRDLKGSYSDAIEWAYSVETIPREHWLAEGHTEDYADSMERLLRLFKDVIKGLNTEEDDRDCNIEFVLQDDDGNHVTAVHDDALMPYWKELANALVHCSEYNAEEKYGIEIQRIETPDAVLDVLCPAMKRAKFYFLSLVGDGTPKSWKLAEFIGDIIRVNHHVTYLELESILLSNEEWKTICHAIRKRNIEGTSTIEWLHVKKCFVGGINAEVLKAILTSNAVDVCLEGNGMSSQEAPIIAEFLNSNPPLAKLDLHDNRFDDADAATLAHSLSGNTNLESLIVLGNNINEEGELALVRAIFDISSLNSCAASNHTCKIDGIDEKFVLSFINSNLRNIPQKVKWDKIFAMLALSSEDSFFNAGLLNGVPASLMPVLLHRAGEQFPEEAEFCKTGLYLQLTGARRRQKHDDWDKLFDMKPINCVYEMMKCWVVPSIYA